MDNLAKGLEDLSLSTQTRRKRKEPQTWQANMESFDANRPNLGSFEVRQADDANVQSFFTSNQQLQWNLFQQQQAQLPPFNPHWQPQGHAVHTKNRRPPQARGSRRSGDPKVFLIERPEPTQQYLEQAARPTVRLKQPRQLLVVLDLNGTLLRKTSSNNTVVARQYANEFLRYLHARHTIMIWSSARPENVQARAQKLFQQAGLPYPKLVWDRTHFDLTKAQYKANVQVYKELARAWHHKDIIAAAVDHVLFDETNTILLDDTEEKAAGEPYNLMKIDEFTRGKPEYCELGQVVAYLEEARYQSNICSYMRQTPFTLIPTMPVYDFDALWTKLEKREEEKPSHEGADETDKIKQAKKPLSEEFKEIAIVSEDEDDGGVSITAH